MNFLRGNEENTIKEYYAAMVRFHTVSKIYKCKLTFNSFQDSYTNISFVFNKKYVYWYKLDSFTIITITAL